MFTSITDWQAEDYMVSVLVDGFASVEAAAAFGNAMGLRLLLAGPHLVLIEPDGTKRVIDDGHVSVVRLRSTSRGKLMTTCEDYEPVSIGIAEYPTTAGLNEGFGSLAYGVRDGAGAIVPFTSARVFANATDAAFFSIDADLGHHEVLATDDP
ncbi:MAG: hypothetical protein ACREPE_10980 [Lysobacter sp.]